MYAPFHLSTGFLLNHYLNGGRSIAFALVFSVLPDLPYMANLLWNGLRKRGKGMQSSDIHGSPLAGHVAAFFHGFPGFAAGCLCVAALNPGLVRPFLIGWLSHLALDYPFHAPDGYHLLYPVPGFEIRSPLSYFDPAFHSRQVNLAALVLTVVGFLGIFL